MPIYEYMCNKCNKPFEFLALNSGDKPACPICAGKSLTRLMSASSIVVSSPDLGCGMGGDCSPDMCGSGGCGGGMCGF